MSNLGFIGPMLQILIVVVVAFGWLISWAAAPKADRKWVHYFGALIVTCLVVGSWLSWNQAGARDPSAGPTFRTVASQMN